MSQIQLVLFDVGNVVLRSTHAITYAILWELGVRPDKAASFFHNSDYGRFARGQITGAQFAQAVREALEAPYLTDELICAAHDAHIYRVDEAVVAVLQELKSYGVPMAVATTTNEWQTDRERELVELTEYAPPERIFRSDEAGLTKTDPGGFQRILCRLRITPGQAGTVLLVDDSTAADKAAKGAGIQTHLYDPAPIVGVAKLRDDLTRRGLMG